MASQRFTYPVHPLALSENIVSGSHYRFTVLTDRLLRLEYDPDGVFEDRASQRIFYRDLPPVPFRAEKEGDDLVITTASLRLRYRQDAPFGRDTLNVTLLTEPASSWAFGEEFEDLGGTAETLDTINGALPVDRGVVSRNGFSVLDDSSAMLLDEDGWVQPRREGVTDVYFFGYGFAYTEAVADFYRLTGKPPMLPAYALGNWWSRYYSYRQQEYLDLMDRFREEDVPFTVSVVDMGWHITDVPEDVAEESRAMNLGPGWTGYTWNKDLFPDYRAFLQELHKRHLKTALNLHPANGVARHEVQYEAMAKARGIDPASGKHVPIDLLSKEAMSDYFDILHHPYEKDGVDFWWMDWQQGRDYRWIHEPNRNGRLKDPREILDPLWLLNHLHIADITRDGKRPMFFSRYSGPGSHRYPVGFSGDSYVTWESLDFQPRFTAMASNIGYGWWSHDIGGHNLGYRDEDLLIRWVQLGVFSPINRLHSTQNDFIRKEPWTCDARHEAVMKDFLRLRHRLFPYLYTMNRRCHEEGLELVQPLYYRYPKASAAYEHKNQFFFGDQLMVAPITEPNSGVDFLGRVETWLPQGDWFDVFTGIRYHAEKARTIEMFRPIERIPVLAKAGGIVPLMVHQPRENRLYNSDAMEVFVFPGADGRFVLYEDEGEGSAFENGAYAQTEMKLAWGDGAVFTISPAEGDRSLIPELRRWTIRFRGFGNIRAEASVAGRTVSCEVQRDDGTHTSTVVLEAGTNEEIRIVLTGSLITDNGDELERCFDLLQSARMSAEVKAFMYKQLCRTDLSIHQRLHRLDVRSYEEQHLHNAIREQLTLIQEEFPR